MDPSCISTIAGLLFIGGITCFVIYAIRYSKSKAMEEVKLLEINSTRPGFAAVKGEVMPMELFRAPVSQRYCVYCYYEIQYYKSGKGSGWYAQIRRTIHKPFLITDPTGAVYVDPKFAKVELPQKIASRFGKGQQLDVNFQKVLEKNNIRAYDCFGGTRQLRCVHQLEKTVISSGLSL